MDPSWKQFCGAIPIAVQAKAWCSMLLMFAECTRASPVQKGGLCLMCTVPIAASMALRFVD